MASIEILKGKYANYIHSYQPKLDDIAPGLYDLVPHGSAVYDPKTQRVVEEKTIRKIDRAFKSWMMDQYKQHHQSEYILLLCAHEWVMDRLAGKPEPKVHTNAAGLGRKE